jgi:hypothetical protein
LEAAATAGDSGHRGSVFSKEVPKTMTWTIEQVQQEHTDEWMAIPGVVGTAIGRRNGRPCILVLAASDTEQVRQRIPSTVNGYPLFVQYMGEIRALDEP